MLLSITSIITLLATTIFSVSASPILAATNSTSNSTSSLPFDLMPVLTANINLGNASDPITIPGGVLISSPVTGGEMTGAQANGTIQGGLAHISVYENGTFSQLDAYGVTEDGYPFLIQDAGVGSSTGEVNRIQFIIGGKYAAWPYGFLLASVKANADQTILSVQGYLATVA